MERLALRAAKRAPPGDIDYSWHSPSRSASRRCKLNRTLGDFAMTRIAHCCCGSLRAEATGEPALVAACHCMECQRRTWLAPLASAPIFRKSRCAPRDRTRSTTAAATRGEKSNSISAPTAAPQCSGTRILARTLSASPLARSLTRRCPGRRYPRGRRRGIPG